MADTKAFFWGAMVAKQSDYSFSSLCIFLRADYSAIVVWPLEAQAGANFGLAIFRTIYRFHYKLRVSSLWEANGVP